MRASQEFIKELEELYQVYEQEVREKSKEGLLTDSTVRTYLLHSRNFVKWCRDDFVPGMKNKN
jgi:hypothetical protein